VRAGKADGIGVALKGRNLGGVDLDHCRDPETGMIEPWAKERLQQFPGAYVEATVSGKGLRILGTSALEGFAPKFKLADKGNGAAIELFGNSNRPRFHATNLSWCAAGHWHKMAAIAAELGGKQNRFTSMPHHHAARCAETEAHQTERHGVSPKRHACVRRSMQFQPTRRCSPRSSATLMILG
jgi:hypothetical protein